MKIKLLRIAGGLGAIACCVWVISCVGGFPGQAAKGKIYFEETRIFIPGNQITAADQAAMTRILGQYDKSLYRIQTFANGQVARETGSMGLGCFSSGIVHKVAENAQLHSLNGVAIQVGRGRGGTSMGPPKDDSDYTETGKGPGGDRFKNVVTVAGSPTPASTRHGNQFNNNRDADRELVAKLRPILEKYNKP
jgi:hypothetical protein